MSKTYQVNTKGQVVIPKPLRDRFGLRPGTSITFREEKGRLVLVKGDLDPVDHVWGAWAEKGLPGKMSTDEFIEAIRGR
ncbi:MAG: AbrB/MazE/SpoVT family DNA-binding domain-containing protein [Candidatus Hydrogenedentota bacterium]|nr:MAG: AbrB/MazE/SpoVT family DNA-binding domain-containing protein [Candidatus Hydrogenedentota bacterium]